MKIWFPFMGVLLLAHIAFAQQQRVDSLLNMLLRHTSEDTVKLGLLTELALAYATADPEKGLVHADSALALAERIGITARRADAFLAKGLNFRTKGDDTTALEMYRTSEQLYTEVGDSVGVAKVEHNIGIVFFNRSDYVQALQSQRRAIGIFETYNENEGKGAALNSTGVVYLYLADYPRALAFFLKALNVFERVGNRQRTAYVLTNIGIVYRRLGKLHESLEYSARALGLHQEVGNKREAANVLANIGNTHDNLGDTRSALDAYKQALGLHQELGNKRGIANCLINMGVVYNGLQQYERAIEYIGRAVMMYEQLKDKNSLAVGYSELGIAYAHAPAGVLQRKGVSLSDRYTKAAELQYKSIALAREIGSLDRQATAWHEVARVYEQQGNARDALAAFRNYIVLHDSVLNDEKREALSRHAMQYEYETKVAMITAEHGKQQAIATAEIARQHVVKNATMGVAAILLFAGVVSFLFYKRHRDADERRRAAEFKALVVETEMKALRSQMNPHFIFNSLNSIADYIGRHDTATASRYLTKFARLMRLILEHSERKEIPLADDLDSLELYMQLESLRMKNKFSYTIIVDESLDTNAVQVPPLLLQPFVENSILHGIARKSGEGRILIHIAKEGRMVRCVVEDNGVGRAHNLADQPPVQRRQSFGMKIAQSRIDILNALTHAHATMEVNDLREGLRVEMKLPFVSLTDDSVLPTVNR